MITIVQDIYPAKGRVAKLTYEVTKRSNGTTKIVEWSYSQLQRARADGYYSKIICKGAKA